MNPTKIPTRLYLVASRPDQRPMYSLIIEVREAGILESVGADDLARHIRDQINLIAPDLLPQGMEVLHSYCPNEEESQA